MDKKAPLSENDLENLLRMHFLESDHVSPQNEKVMEILAENVFGKSVVSPLPAKRSLKSFLKKWGLLIVSVPVLVFVSLSLFDNKKSIPAQQNKQQDLDPVTSEVTNDQNEIPSFEPEHSTLPVAVNKSSEKTETDSAPDVSEEKTLLFEIKNPTTLAPIQEATPARKELQDDYRIPVLTPEEKKANQKQKRKMLEKLIKSDKSTWAYIPSGTFVYKGDTVSLQAFRMRTTEITNLEYRTFLFDLLINGDTETFLKAKPTQHLWTTRFNKAAYNKPMEENYFSHPAYNPYPVVNISREGALLFCKWMTVEANKLLQQSGKPLMNDLRLPHEQEWAYAAKGGIQKNTNSSGNDSLKNAKSCYLVNYSCLDARYGRYDSTLKYWIPTDGNGLKMMSDGGFHTVNGSSYLPNNFGLYCMSGNASEMIVRYNLRTGTTETGTIGGSWLSPDRFLNVEADEEWIFEKDGPSPMIGFRPVFTFLTK